MSVRLDKRTRERFTTVTALTLEWYDANRRDFPWRCGSRDAYMHLVSEYMLQQTGTTHVVNRLARFLLRFPTIQHLAAAPSEEVIAEWQGLGYNRRALNLHRTARLIVGNFGGTIPETIGELKTLPGIGLYTASAIAAFAFDAEVPVVDVNIHRVLSRVWKPATGAGAMLPLENIIALDELIMPRGRTGDWHQALMDLGAMVCTKSRPKCVSCPLVEQCKSAAPFLDSTHVRAPKRHSTEPQYFGSPRRIWRGRVLKVISNGEGVTMSHLLGELSNKWLHSGIEFESFIRSILTSFMSEGLVSRTKLSYTLGSK